MTIKTPSYTAVVHPSGGILESLRTPDGREWSGQGGLCEDAEGGLPGQLRKLAYTGTPAASGAETRLDMTGHGIADGIIDWEMTVRKSFRFLHESPVVEICLRLENAGSREKVFSSFRIHNAIPPETSAVFFSYGVAGINTVGFEPDTHHYVKTFSSGLAGCFIPEAQQVLLFQMDKSQIQQFLFFMGNNVCTVEWFMKRIAVPPCGHVELAYRMLVLPAKDIAAVDAFVKSPALRVRTTAKSRRSNAPSLLAAQHITHLDAFSRMASLWMARQAASTRCDTEEDVLTADGWRHDLVRLAPHGGGLDLCLPDVPTISIRARVSMRAGQHAPSEAGMLCCDPDGHPYAAAQPARMDRWRPSAELVIDVSLLRGKSARLGLFGPDAVWTDLKIVSDLGEKTLFGSLRLKPGDLIDLAGMEAAMRKLPLRIQTGDSPPVVNVHGYDADGNTVQDISVKAVSQPDLAPHTYVYEIAPGSAAVLDVQASTGNRRVQERLELPPPCPSEPCAAGVSIEVRPAGSTAAQQPNTVGSLQAARDRIRQLRSEGVQSPVTVIVRGGVHRLSRPLTLASVDSGSAQAPIVYMAEPGAQVILSGGRCLDKSWQKRPDGTWQYTLPRDLAPFRTMTLGERALPRSRWPREGTLQVEPAGHDAKGRPRLRVLADALADAPDLSNAEFMAQYTWCGECFNVVDVQPAQGLITLSRPLNNTKRVITACHFQNVPDPALLPGHWFADPQARRLVYRPRPREDRAAFAPTVPQLQELVRMRGETNARCVRHIHFRGFTCRDVRNDEQDEGAQAAVRVSGAITMENTGNCAFSGNRFCFMEGAALELRAGCHRNVICGNELFALGGGGIRVGLGYVGHLPDIKQQANRPASSQNVICGNHIHHAGRRHCGAVGIWIGQSGYNFVVDNHLHHLPYSGISAGWTWGRGENPAQNNRIEANVIHDVMLEMHDGGGIYTLGASPGTTVCRNRIWNVPNGNAIYLDEGSAGIRVSGNDARSHHVGLFLHGACGNWIEDNRFREATQAALLFSDCAGQMSANAFLNNSFSRGENGGLFIRATGWHDRYVVLFSGNRMLGWAPGIPSITGIARVKTLTAWQRMCASCRWGARSSRCRSSGWDAGR